MDATSMVYMTCASQDEALAIAKHLLTSKLAACCNILGQINSIYVWQGQLTQGTEVAMLAKTRSALVPELMASVRQRHSYQTPCLIAWPIAEGDPAFLTWISDQTRPQEPR